jgi:hypothetical protein
LGEECGGDYSGTREAPVTATALAPTVRRSRVASQSTTKKASLTRDTGFKPSSPAHVVKRLDGVPMNRNSLRERLRVAWQALKAYDEELLAFDAAERAIAGKFAAYLGPLFPTYHVDVEYNREGHEQESKHLPLPTDCSRSGRLCPDIIIHERGNDHRNLAVIEVKISTNPESRECDRIKVAAMMREKHYKYGLLIDVPAGVDWRDRRLKIRWLRVGAV